MATYYKHKETEEIYDNCGYSNYNGIIELEFYPFNKKLKPIIISTPKEIDTDALYKKIGICEEYRAAQKLNNETALEHALKTFEKVELNIKRELKDTIIPGVYELVYYCPLCGSKMKETGGAYLTSPLQYDNFCTKDECGFNICTSRWHSGSLVCGTDKNEIERIITSGTFEEQEELEKYSKKMLKYVGSQK